MNRQRRWQLENTERYKEKQKRYRDSHSDKTKTYMKEWREKNKEEQKLKVKQNKKIRQEWLNQYKSTLSCVKCGFNNPAALDFHHKDDNKEFSISRATLSKSIKSILAEIAKCEVLCANCHRIHHHENK